MRQCAGIVFRIGWNFRQGLVAGGADELLELPVCHRRAVYPETADRDAMSRRLFRIMFVRTHAEGAARNPNHVRVIRLLQSLD